MIELHPHSHPGIAVPSVTSFAYYAVFLSLLALWGLHLRLQQSVRLLRAAVMFYSALHILMLDLYQFQGFQSAVSVFVEDSPSVVANTTDSLLARYACEWWGQVNSCDQRREEEFVSQCVRC